MNDSFSDNKNIVSPKELHESVIKAFIRQKNRGQNLLYLVEEAQMLKWEKLL